MEKGGEAALALGEGLIQRKVLAQMGLALAPHLLGWLLVGGMGSKAQTRDLPVSLGQAVVRLCEQLLDLFPAVIPCSVPEID